MSQLPPPRDLEAPIGRLVRELAGHLGEPTAVEVCVAMLTGVDRRAHLAELPYLTGRPCREGDPILDPTSWKDYWVRTWGARGLLHIWDDRATDAVVGGLDDRHWRPAEMCLKVSTRRELGQAGPGAARLATHELPRVRSEAMRTLGAAGDTEHVDAVCAALDDDHPGVRRQAARALEALRVRLDLP